MVDINPAGLYLMNLASGTSQNPLSWPMPMLMMHFGRWNTMFMSNAFVVDTPNSALGSSQIRMSELSIMSTKVGGQSGG
jgi:hypothetical protein